MPAKIAVPTATRTNANARRSTLVCSVDQAFDVMDSLPARKRRLPCWREARKALRRARDNPQDGELANNAASAFRAALLAEEWLL
jgi:hypothetical protein